MKVRDFIEALQGADQEAQVYIIADNKLHTFTIEYGFADGCTYQKCQEIYLDSYELNNKETERTQR